MVLAAELDEKWHGASGPIVGDRRSPRETMAGYFF